MRWVSVLLFQVASVRTSRNGLKLQKGRLSLDIMKFFFHAKGYKALEYKLREVVESSYLKVLKKGVDMAFDNMV